MQMFESQQLVCLSIPSTHNFYLSQPKCILLKIFISKMTALKIENDLQIWKFWHNENFEFEKSATKID